jgi:hypothetical protein
MTNTQTNRTAPIHYLEATTLAALIRTKQLSSREVVQAHLDRTEALNPKINAVVTAAGAVCILSKPFDDVDLEHCISTALSR